MATLKYNPADSACLKYLLSGEAPSPCFTIDLERLESNARILADVQKSSGAKILLALKGYSAWATFPLLSRAFSGPLWGTCASSVDEARLGREKFGGEVHAFAAAWSEEEIDELLGLADHVVFNSIAQWQKFRPKVEKANLSFRSSSPISCGLRLNPEHSEGAVAIYNPCSPSSRLGIRPRELASCDADDLEGISGLHFHTLCEQGADALQRTLQAFEQKFSPLIPGKKWLNFGGGHHITRPGYDIELLNKCLVDWKNRYCAQIYLEPGEAVALNAGWLVATVLDIVQADMPVAILDVSACCHMPDVLEMPYTPHVWYNGAKNRRDVAPKQAGESGAGKWQCRLAGKSCLAGDIIGEYGFDFPLAAGDILVFEDMAIYSMVKTTTFNGLRLPSIAIFGEESQASRFRVIKNFGYEDFKDRLS